MNKTREFSPERIEEELAYIEARAERRRSSWRI